MSVLLFNIIDAVVLIGHALISAYMLVVVVACCLSWFNVSPYSRFSVLVRRLTEGVFAKVRSLVPFSRAGGMDFSPLIVIIGLQLLDMVVLRSLRQLMLSV